MAQSYTLSRAHLSAESVDNAHTLKIRSLAAAGFDLARLRERLVLKDR